MPVARERLTKTFMDMAAISSPSGKETRMVEYVVARLEKLGISSQQDAFGNVIAKLPGEGQPILLSAHLDTVEPAKGVMPVLEGGIIRSAGQTILGADNKAAVAAILECCEARKGGRSLNIVFTLSEEAGNQGAWNLDYSLLEARQGFCFDSSKPLGTIISAAPFYDRFDIVLQGRAAHASRPSEALNPLPLLRELLSEVRLGAWDDHTRDDAQILL